MIEQDATLPHILLVDDEPSIRQPLAQYLKKQGFRVSEASHAAAARDIFSGYAIDIILLDIMMPGEDGLSFCRYVRENSETPVIFLTAKSEETERIIGLEMGADDYVVKPFSPRELVARIKVILRRAGAAARRAKGSERKVFSFAGWTLKVAEQILLDAEQVNIPLSTGEFKLLTVFLNHAGQVLNRDQLLDLTQGRDAHAFDRSIDNQISRLRRKIEQDAKNPLLIKTIWGGGYCFTAEVEFS